MRTVYMCMSTDIIHNGHINIITKAAALGELTVGVLTDQAISKYKRFPLLGFSQRCSLISSIKGVSHVVAQESIDYEPILKKLRPDIVVHGDDWKTGVQRPIRERVLSFLKCYGGELIEFPYTYNSDFARLEGNVQRVAAMPEIRRGRLKQMLQMKPLLRIMEAHNGLTGLIVEKTAVHRDNGIIQFDGMWISSLCDSTAKGKPDIELVDNTSRFQTINEIQEVTTKPIILDGDTGGLTEHFPFFVKSLERMGVSAVIIEDKKGLKRNSLYGTQVEQMQEDISAFSQKIKAGCMAQTTSEFMIIARIESLILEKGMNDALDRAFAFVDAGAKGIMIHSRQKSPNEVFEFCREFRAHDEYTPLVVVPTTYQSVTEEEFEEHGINIVIYANQLIRSAFPAMQNTAKTILMHGRCLETDSECMPIKEILDLIPEK